MVIFYGSCFLTLLCRPFRNTAVFWVKQFALPEKKEDSVRKSWQKKPTFRLCSLAELNAVLNRLR